MRTAAREAGAWNTEHGARNEDDTTAAEAARQRTARAIISSAIYLSAARRDVFHHGNAAGKDATRGFFEGG
jgi:hypothetical protein